MVSGCIFLQHNVTIANTGSCECNVWFDQSTKQVSSLLDLWSAHEILSAEEQAGVSAEQGTSNPRKRKRPLNDSFSMVHFKNVKLANSAAKDESVMPKRSPQQGPGAVADHLDSSLDSDLDGDYDSDLDSEAGFVKKRDTTETGEVDWERLRPVEFNHAISYVNKVKVG